MPTRCSRSWAARRASDITRSWLTAAANCCTRNRSQRIDRPDESERRLKTVDLCYNFGANRGTIMAQSRLKEPKSERIAALAAVPHAERSPGCQLDLGWVEDVRVNRSAVERRPAPLPGRRTVKQDWQAAWLLRAV